MLKGSFNTTGYKTSSGDNITLLFKWERTNASIENNQSTISWSLEGDRKNKGYVKAGNIKVVIEGETVYQETKNRINLYDGTPVASGTKVINHNTDGSKTFSCSVEAGIYVVAVNAVGSASFELDQIPRCAEITQANNFTDEDNPVIKYNNPAGGAVSSLKGYIYYGDTLVKEDNLNKTDNTHTFVLSDSERSVLRKATIFSNTLPITFKIQTIIGSTPLWGQEISKTMTIVNNTPTIAIDYTDNNPATVALTGYSKILVKGQSNFSYTITAQAYKEGKIEGCYAEAGGQRELGTQNTILGVTSNNVLYGVVDNRGNRVEKTLTNLPFVPYVDVTCNVKTEIKLEGETNAKLLVNLEGNYYSGSFGQVTNELFVNMRYGPVGGTMSNWKPVTEAYTPIFDVANKTYALSVELEDLDYNKTYTLEVKANDKLSSYEVPAQAIRLTPVFDWSDRDFNFNVPVKFMGETMSDMVIDEGQMSDWTYRIWLSGKLECWRRLQITTSVNTAWGSLYSSGSLSSTNLYYPFTFKETPILNVALMPFGSGGFLMAPGNGYGSATQTGPLEIARGTAMSSGQFLISYYAVGSLA